jgi:hypothetical protein
MLKILLITWSATIICSISCIAAAGASGDTTSEEPVHGISLAHLHRRGFGYGSEECRKQLSVIKQTGANWIAINDFAYMEKVDRPSVVFERDGTMRGKDLAQVITDAHAAGLKVLVKPHLWSNEFWHESKWHGDIKMTSEADWDEWFKQYGDYVLYNATVADSTKADAFCVGVEYQGTSGQEIRWRKLIADVRKVYHGPLTYAATFMEWKQITWWDAVDCIGIDAYFPVADHKSATESDLRRGWQRAYDEITPIARKLNRKICFTELGYSDSPKAGQEPWSYDQSEQDPDYQARLYKVALEEASKHQDIVCGLFVWKWFTSDQFRKVEHRDPFVMQDRAKVIETLREAWSTTGASAKPTD